MRNLTPRVALTLLLLAFGCDEPPPDAGPDRGSEPGDRDGGRRGDRDTGAADDANAADDALDDASEDASGDDANGASDAADSGGDAPVDAADTGTDGSATDSGLSLPDVGDADFADGTGVYDPDGGGTVDPELCPAEDVVPGRCLAPLDEVAARLCDGFDNDCDGQIDEGCTCKLGEVQPCFTGPPGRVDVGACSPGTQRCITGADGDETWGSCTGGIGPRTEICDGLDNDCNGCTDEVLACDPEGTCPGPDDPRVPEASPFTAYPLHGRDFYGGEALAWSWTIQGGPCDGVVPGRRSFDLTGPNSENATFTPRLSGSYTVTLRVTTPDGVFECTWVIHVTGPGLRVEMCYPESMTQDLDLLLMPTRSAGPWYPAGGDAFDPNANACSWWNCEASLRGAPRRVDWGYANTDIANCSGGPQGAQWRSLGYCANPRLDIDNNLSEGTGLPENINVDNPGHLDEFRIMVQNFTGTVSRPIVNVYCGGRLVATYGAAPDTVPGYSGASGSFSIGAMWRVADVRVLVDDDGTTLDCTVNALHPPGTDSGYDVSRNDPRF